MSSIPLAAQPAPASAPPALWKIYSRILVPMMLTNVLQSAGGTLDSIYLGQMIGVDAIAAASAFFPVFFLLLALAMGLSTGATVLIGQAWGAGDRAAVRKVAGSALALAVCVGVAVCVAGGLWAPALMHALGTPPDIAPEAARYARLMLMGAPLLLVLWLATSLSRGVGDAVTPLWALALATVVALALTPAFIRGWGGLPRLGVCSAALSTLLGSAVALVWMLHRWLRKGHPLAPDAALLREVRLDPVLLRKLIGLGLPTGLQMLSMALGEIVLIGLVNRHGMAATAAYGAVTQLMGWLQMPAMSLGITATILASHAIGAGRGGRLGAIMRVGLGWNLALTGTFVAAAYVLAPFALRCFLTDPAVIALALQLLHIVAWAMLMRGASMVLSGVMRASGTVWWPTAMGVSAIFVVELPLAYLLNARLGLTGIWWAYCAAFTASLGMQAGFYAFVWRRRAVQRLI
ncbi:MAG: MATE family efflux transporter [Rhizobacter sp.]